MSGREGKREGVTTSPLLPSSLSSSPLFPLPYNELLISDNHALRHRLARNQRRPERDDFRCARPALIGDVGDSRHRAEDTRHNLRRETRVDLPLVVIANRELHQHLARLARGQRRVTRIPPDELMQRLVVQARPPALSQNASATLFAFASASGPETMRRPNARHPAW